MLSYDRILNFVTGARGIGKSYGLKKYVINRFLKHGEQFIYVRRYKPELKKLKNWFDDISPEFPGVEFKVKGREFYINGKLAGWGIPLSSWQNEKSNAYPNVCTILFDEFIREKDGVGYLPNEVASLLNLMDTTFRNRENVRVICLSNAVTIINPYFIYFNLIPNTKRRFNAYQNCLIEIPDSSDFADQRKKTKLGKLIADTEYGRMSLENEFVNDSETFIAKRTKQSKFVFTIIFNGVTMGVWFDSELCVLYLSLDHDPQSKYVYAMTTTDFKDNTILMTTWKKNYHLFKMVTAFKNGVLRFETQLVRTRGYELLARMNVQ